MLENLKIPFQRLVYLLVYILYLPEFELESVPELETIINWFQIILFILIRLSKISFIYSLEIFDGLFFFFYICKQ